MKQQSHSGWAVTEDMSEHGKKAPQHQGTQSTEVFRAALTHTADVL